MAVTIKHVAKAAGVAVGTVSRVLAKNKTVNEEIRIRVEDVIQELGYKPNSIGRSLRLNKTDLIGLVIPDITNPFFAELAKHVEMLASAEGYSVLLANSHDDPAAEQQQVQALLGRLPSGMILVPVSESVIGDLVRGKNTVTVDRPLKGQTLVGVDNRRGGYLAADHLLSLGHRRIAYMGGPPALDVARERREGFVGRIREFQQKNPSQSLAFQTVDGNFDYRAGEELGNRLLRQEGPHRPTAIATASDQQAIGLMRATADLGLSIPNDLSIVGFDDIPLASLVLPRLTTIRQPLAEIARIALDAILNRPSVTKECKLEPVLVERNSTRAWSVR
ncbi:LacI family DNA-binding transcriptional regulator [Ensifer sp. BR816]|uniref:LacI family DNA-binding transcriptional regulator n=1 Tax=Rhizobium sp. (strain BR816) TaxID=1057002 RepID=UPI00037BCC41|nr:LacI family DNA-binding transcriptional regulator [Ensifer sp. BR816]